MSFLQIIEKPAGKVRALPGAGKGLGSLLAHGFSSLLGRPLLGQARAPFRGDSLRLLLLPLSIPALLKLLLARILLA